MNDILMALFQNLEILERVIQLELQVLGYSIYTILAMTYQPIGYEPEIRR